MAGTSVNDADEVLNLKFNGGTYTQPASLDICITTAPPTTAGDGTIVEPTVAQYAGYARQTITANTTNFPAAAAGSIASGTAITFPTSTGGASAPVSVTNIVARNHATGRIIGIANLPGGTQIASGQTPQLPAGALTFTCS